MPETLEQKLTTECDAWFARVEAILGHAPEPEEEWAALWFDGYTPEEAVEEIA